MTRQKHLGRRTRVRVCVDIESFHLTIGSFLDDDLLLDFEIAGLEVLDHKVAYVGLVAGDGLEFDEVAM